jgi:hypothetical protein
MSKSGIKTPNAEIDLIDDRLKRGYNQQRTIL